MSELTGLSVGEYVPQVLVGLPYFVIPQIQPHVVNDFPSSNFIALCRLCLGTYFGAGSTTIINEQLIIMMKQVFPILIVNQIGLPMNVCCECVKKVETFYIFSMQVLANQQKLLQTSMHPIQPNLEEELRQSVEVANQNQETQVACEEEIPIDADMLIKIEPDTDLDEPDPLTAADDIVFDVIDEIPGIKMEEEMLNPTEIKIEEEPYLQLEDKEEAVCNSSSETSDESDDQAEDHLANEQPKKRRQVIYRLKNIPTMIFCPVHSRWFEKISNEQELIELNRRLQDDDYMNQLINVLQKKTSMSKSKDKLLMKAMDILFDKYFWYYIGWSERLAKIPLKHQTNILELFNKLGSPIGTRMSNYEIKRLIIRKVKNATRKGHNPLSERKALDQMELIDPPENCCELKLKKINSESLLKEFNRQLEDDDFMQQVIKYLQYLTGKARSELLMHRSLDIIFDRSFFKNCYWLARPGKVTLPRYSNILELFGRLGTPVGARLPEHEIRTFLQYKLMYEHRRFKSLEAQRIRMSEVSQRSEAELPSETAQQESLSDLTQIVEGGVQKILDKEISKQQSIDQSVGDYRTLQLKQITSKEKLDEFNSRLEDDDFMTQVINYLQFETGHPTSFRLMNRSLDMLFDRKFFYTSSWAGRRKNIKFSSYTRILELFCRLGATNGVKLSGSEIRKYFDNKYKAAKQRINQVTYTKSIKYKTLAQATEGL